jgi:hypothetical protein
VEQENLTAGVRETEFCTRGAEILADADAGNLMGVGGININCVGVADELGNRIDDSVRDREGDATIWVCELVGVAGFGVLLLDRVEENDFDSLAELEGCFDCEIDAVVLFDGELVLLMEILGVADGDCVLDELADALDDFDELGDLLADIDPVLVRVSDLDDDEVLVGVEDSADVTEGVFVREILRD